MVVSGALSYPPKEQSQQFPVLTQIVNGDSDQEQAADEIDNSAMTGDEDGQLAVERNREKRENQERYAKSQSKPKKYPELAKCLPDCERKGKNADDHRSRTRKRNRSIK